MAWGNHTAFLLAKIFDGSDEGTDAMGKLFNNAAMMKVKRSDVGPPDYDAIFKRQANIHRLFYASAIPAAWGANLMALVVVDFWRQRLPD